MANKNLGILILIATLVAQATWVRAKEYIVGDDKGWAPGVDYDAWIKDKEIFQGDKLVFRFERETRKLYYTTHEKCNACCPNDPLMEMYPCGNNCLTVMKIGKRCVMSTREDCLNGMKLLFEVKPAPVLQECGETII
ncbi:putative Phytocyanin domain, cupredoxin [Helianthus debilis subsp. tardiflorus]